MITDSDVNRLLAARSTRRSVLSLYLRIPADPAELRELPARAHGLMTLAVGNGGAPDDLSAGGGLPGPDHAGTAGGGHREVTASAEQDEREARDLLEAHGRQWLGHTAAIFVDAGTGLSETYALPCQLPDRAVLAERPHVRPLLVAKQRCPSHHVVVVDRQRSWLLRVSGDQIEMAAAQSQADEMDEVRSRGFGGWYGLDSHRVNDRVIELEHQHLEDALSLVEHAMRTDQDPLVVGGHEDTVARFVGLLPGDLRARLAGTFMVDPHTMTPARIRDLARPVIADWVGMHEQSLSIQMREGESAHDPLTVSGLSRCLEAVNQHAADVLVVPVGGVIAGYVCERCGALGAAVTGCPDGPAESRWVPDLFEEMVTKTIGDGGRAEALADPPGDVAAHLRFPVISTNGR